MRKALVLLLVLLVALSTAACDGSGSVTPPAADPEPVRISAFNQFGGSTALFSEEDSTPILELLERDGWVNDLTNCGADILLHLPDGEMRYHSECGSFIDYENRRSLTLSDEEQENVNAILSRYITLGYFDPTQPTNEWGITLTVKSLSPTGLTLVCTQSGGSVTGELNTGSYYVIERLGPDNGWKPLEYVELEGEFAWTADAWIVPMNDTVEWDVNWAWLYGELPAGIYRIGKEFMDFRGAGDYDKMMIYGEFIIG